MTPPLSTLQAHADLLNVPGQQFRAYVGFGNEVRISVDARLESPPKTSRPEGLGKVPVRPAAMLGPNRIGFVQETMKFFGGRSANRWRKPCRDHTWRILKDGVDVTSDSAHVYFLNITDDIVQTYVTEPQPANLFVAFAQAGIYTVELTVTGDYGDYSGTHTGTRQVIVYPSRQETPAGVVEVSSIAGSVSQGGWTCSLRLRGDLSTVLQATEIEGYIPVVVMVEPYTEGLSGDYTSYEVGVEWHAGKQWDDPRILFNGYIDRETVSVDVDKSEVRFDCRTADMILEQMQTHVVGFFESSGSGAGVTFNDLMYHDVVRYMLLEKSDFGDFHDLRFFHNWGLLPWETWTESMQGTEQAYGTYTVDNDQVPNQEYNDWTFNNGQYWSNIRDGSDNQFELCYFSRDGALFLHPDRNMWPPQVFYDMNEVNEWNEGGGTYDGPYSSFGEPLAIVPIGPEDRPLATISGQKNPNAIIDDDYVTNPWETADWTGLPAHIALRLTVSAKLSAVPSYYKLVGNLSFWQEEWGADYPPQATDESKGLWLLSGAWTLIQGKYWSDQDHDRAWRNIWRFAARGYAAVRARYRAEAQYGLHTYFRLCDMLSIVYRDPLGRFDFVPSESGAPSNWFEIDGISYAPNIENGTWTTSYQMREVTIYNAPTPTIPEIPES
jgi:hypothetical protein